MKHNIIITGGAGYVGASLCEALNASPEVESIVVYDELIRNDRRFFFGSGDSTVLEKVRFVRGDILDTRRLSKACRGMNVMIHLAAFVDEPFTYSQHTQYDQSMRTGPLRSRVRWRKIREFSGWSTSVPARCTGSEKD